METITAGGTGRRVGRGGLAAGLALGLGVVTGGALGAAPPVAAARVASATASAAVSATNTVRGYAGELFSYSPGVATPVGPGSWQLASPASSLPAGLGARTDGTTVVLAGVPPSAESSSVLLRYVAGARTGVVRVTIDVRAHAAGWATSYFTLEPAPPASLTTAVPVAVDWSTPVESTMLGNSSYNDCVVAAGYHLAVGQAASVGVTLRPPTEAMALATYRELISGPVTTDASGADEESMLSLEAASGLDGMRAIAASSLELHSRAQLEAAVDELGGVLASIDAAPVNPEASTWTLALSSEQISHEVAVVGYDSFGPLLSTWGRLVRASWGWWDAHVSSVTAVIPSAFMSVGHGPSGVAIATLLARFGGQFHAPQIEAPASAVTAVGQYVTDVMTPVGYPIASATVAGEMPAGIRSSPYGYGTQLTGAATVRGVGAHELEMTVTSPIGVAVVGLELTVVPAHTAGPLPYVDYLPAGQPYSSEWGVDGAHSYIAHNLVSGMTVTTKGAWVEIAGTPRVGGQRAVTVVDGFGGHVPSGTPLYGLKIVSVVAGVLSCS